MFKMSGTWAFDIKLPAKSAYQGVTILVVPNVMGIAVWSPILDKYANSIKANKFYKMIVPRLGLNSQDIVYGDGLAQQQESHKVNGLVLIFHAKNGDLRQIRRLVAKGHDVNYKDYDDRTALHLAVAEGHLKIVKYLVLHGADTNCKDLHDQTPMSIAKKKGFTDIVDFLTDY